ncbi:hypothetical protein [Methylorubrum extorquens]|uniref:hypothetical protein n=1 Tax=Methylorubrum extorquens TaxID=408 RepID=UPI0012DB039D|nr:hypothetical protein [Methylorubrum extorquens]
MPATREPQDRGTGGGNGFWDGPVGEEGDDGDRLARPGRERECDWGEAASGDNGAGKGKRMGRPR